MGVMKLLKSNVSKYRYNMVSYMLVEYFCGLDDIMHIVDGTVDIKKLDFVSFLKCGLLDNLDNIIDDIISGNIVPENVIISDKKLVNTIDTDNLSVEFENAMRSFVDSFKIEVKPSGENKKEEYYNPEFYNLEHDWEGLKMIYITKCAGTEKEFFKSTLGEILTKINKYCEIENGKYTFNRYHKAKKSDTTEQLVKEMARKKYKLLEEDNNG